MAKRGCRPENGRQCGGGSKHGWFPAPSVAQPAGSGKRGRPRGLSFEPAEISASSTQAKPQRVAGLKGDFATRMLQLTQAPRVGSALGPTRSPQSRGPRFKIAPGSYLEFSRPGPANWRDLRVPQLRDPGSKIRHVRHLEFSRVGKFAEAPQICGPSPRPRGWQGVPIGTPSTRVSKFRQAPRC